MRKCGTNSVFAILAAVWLGGCSSPQQLALTHGVAVARDAKDTEAEMLKAAVCAMSLGAYHRLNTAVERSALDVLCGGIAPASIGLKDALALSRLLEVLDDGQGRAGAQ